MQEKGSAMSAALLSIIVVFTIFASGSRDEFTMIGSLAQFLIPALLTIYLLVILYSARVIMDLFASFLLGSRQHGDSQGRSWMVVVGYAIATVLVIILIKSASLQNLAGYLATAVAATSSLLKLGQMPTPQTTASMTNPYLFYYVLLIFGAIILVSFILLIGGVHTAYRWAREEHAPISQEKLRRETLHIVERAARDLRSTDDYRRTILNCYLQMCHVLSLHGFQTERYETATEFSRNVSNRLGLGGDPMRELTQLFEEARYSDHDIDNAKRALALNQLETLERSLGNVSG